MKKRCGVGKERKSNFLKNLILVTLKTLGYFVGDTGDIGFDWVCRRGIDVIEEVIAVSKNEVTRFIFAFFFRLESLNDPVIQIYYLPPVRSLPLHFSNTRKNPISSQRNSKNPKTSNSFHVSYHPSFAPNYLSRLCLNLP